MWRWSCGASALRWRRASSATPRAGPRSPRHADASRLTVSGYARASEDFEVVQSELMLVGIDQPLARRAGVLAAELGLRGYDAIHLATALALGPDTTTLVTWDRDLAHAAARTGCAVAPPVSSTE